MGKEKFSSIGDLAPLWDGESNPRTKGVYRSGPVHLCWQQWYAGEGEEASVPPEGEKYELHRLWKKQCNCFKVKECYALKVMVQFSGIWLCFAGKTYFCS